MNNFYDYEAIKLAENEADWMIYFKSIAQYFIKAFAENYEKLRWWSIWIDENPKNANNEAIKNRLMSYYQLFLGLSPDINHNLNINKDILNKFVKTQNYEKSQDEKVIKFLGLNKCEVLGNLFTIDQLMNITLSFFHDVQFRIKFFSDIIYSSRDSLRNNTTISQLLSKTEASIFSNINA